MWPLVASRPGLIRRYAGALEREAHGSAEPMKQGDRLPEGIGACDLPPGCKFWGITS